MKKSGIETIQAVQSFTTYTAGDQKQAGEEEDPVEQARECSAHQDVDATNCITIPAIGTELRIMDAIPKPIEPGGRRPRVRLARVLYAFVESNEPPASTRVPNDARVIAVRGGPTPMHRVIRPRRADPRSRYLRIWSLAEDERGRAVFASTFLFALGEQSARRVVEKRTGATKRGQSAPK